MATTPAEPRPSFVSKLVSDPKQPPNTLLLMGYLGDSSDPGHTRLYFDAQLASYVEIPDDAILYQQEASKDQSALGANYVWVKRDAPLIHGPIGPNRLKASFLEGRLAQDFGGAPIPIPTVVPHLCPTDFGPQCVDPTTLGPHCHHLTTPGPGCPPPTLPAICGFTHLGPACQPTHMPVPCPPPTHNCPPVTQPPQCLPFTHFQPQCGHVTQPPQCLPVTQFPPQCPPVTQPPQCLPFTHFQPQCGHVTQPPQCLPVTHLLPQCQPHTVLVVACGIVTHSPVNCGITFPGPACIPVTGAAHCAPSLAGCPSGVACNPGNPLNPGFPVNPGHFG